MKPPALKSFVFRAKVWLYQGTAAWHFITLPKNRSARIKSRSFGLSSALGSIRVRAKVGKSEWKTSIFPDTKAGAYLLPLKAEIRRKENISAGKTITVTLMLEDGTLEK